MSRAQALALTTSLLLTSTFAGTFMNGTAGDDTPCNDYNVYYYANSSSSYNIPSISTVPGQAPNTSNSTITLGTDLWQVESRLRMTTGGLNNLTNQTGLEHYIFLDTASSQNDKPAIPSGLAACSFIFSLPQNDMNKRSDTGACDTVIGEDCANDLNLQVYGIAQSLSNRDSIWLEDACKAITTNLSMLPNSCSASRGKNVDNIVLAESSGVNLTYQVNSADNCAAAPSNMPIPLYGEEASLPNGNYSLYDQWGQTITPVILVFFSNNTIYHNEPFAATNLVCTEPTDYTPGSIAPNTTIPGGSSKSSAGERNAIVDSGQTLLLALGLISLLFFML